MDQKYIIFLISLLLIYQDHCQGKFLAFQNKKQKQDHAPLVSQGDGNSHLPEQILI